MQYNVSPSLAVAIAIASTHVAYPRRDDQAELTRLRSNLLQHWTSLEVLYKSATGGRWLGRILVVAARWTDPDVAVIAEYDRSSTRQTVKVSLTTFDQRTWNIDQNTLT